MSKCLVFIIAAFCIIGSYGDEKADNETTIPDTTIVPSSTKLTDKPTLKPTTLPPTTASSTEPPTSTTTTPKTSPEPTSSTVAPTPSTVAPTPVPSPSIGKWEVRDEKKNSTCIRVHMAVQFKISYKGKDWTLNLSPNATTDGSSCSPPENNTQLLVLEVAGDYKFSLTFARDDLTSFVRNISLELLHPEELRLDDNERHFSAHTDKSYLCKSATSVSIGNSTIEFSEIQVQAFMHNEKDFSQAEDCYADDKMNDIVPIAVGCALAAMVVLILVVYLVTRRKRGQQGYQTM